MKKAYIVPCTEVKIWTEQPNAGPTAAKDAYIGTEKRRDIFRKWRDEAEKSGLPWFILSTEYGLIEPEKLITDYNVGVSVACADPNFKSKLRTQGKEFGLDQCEKVILLDWEKFEPLVKAAIGDGKAQYELKKICY